MDVTVKLKDIVEGMEMDFEDGQTLLNRTTGEVRYIANEFINRAEEGEPYDHLPEWMHEEMELANDIIEHEDNYLPLPTRFDIHEYQILEDFCFIQTEKVQVKLLNVIRGKGAFRRFKDKLFELGIVEEWYSYRDKRYEEIAVEFCKEYGLKYI